MNSINKKISLLKKGDKYLRISPYGGVTTGIVESIFYTKHQYHPNNEKYTYKIWSFTNDVGITLDLNGNDGEIYKLEQ